ncbi:MAG TPA: HAD-IIA family hydrolase [Jatrophihabitantaceae bacterium]|nr:HAD-IIA family hydrolase [Jatrophihabitantaceae bacterium]
MGTRSTVEAADASPWLQESPIPLAQRYDVALLDLDGVVYVGRHAVAGAPDALAAARAAGMRLAFVTNNAARPPTDVAAHLRELGIAADADEVITSSQAAAGYLADRLPPAAKVLVVGTTGLIEALRERGLDPVFSADDDPVAVVQGYSPTLDWKQLAEGAVAINRGALWVATNVDPTVPSRRGPLPGNGSLVAALRHATGAVPIVTGKPEPTMHRETVVRSGAQAPIVVGDRLDTDVEGANATGCPSLLVLSGVTTPQELLAADPVHRPTYLAHDLSGLLRAHPGAGADHGTGRCGRWTAVADASALRVSRDASSTSTPDTPSDGDDLDVLRALCAAAWTAPQPADGWRIEPVDGVARSVLEAGELLA